jgi:hypothetical protein
MRMGLLVIAVLTFGVSWADTLPAPVDYGKVSAIDLVNHTAKGVFTTLTKMRRQT